jgi:AraC-like DNA-binding protein
MPIATSTPFNDALEDLRISGSVLLHEAYEPPWAIDVPGEAMLRQMIGVGLDVRVLPFHLVRRGEFHLRHNGREPAHIGAEEVVICPSGAPHRMSFGSKAKPISLAHILKGQSSGKATTRSIGTELVCGVFLLRSAPLNPMLAALPPVLKVKTGGPDANPMLMRAAEMLGMELAHGRRGSFTASRLLEVFCAEAIRSYRQREGAECPGWFKALDDPRIGQALSQIHQRPGAPWTVASLAEAIAMSPSRFAARFRETTGQTAMSYVANWRMNVACRILRETDRGLAAIAADVGYQDVAAFSRAFKALVGASPAKWRASQRS